MLPANAEFEVQMWPGCPTRATDGTQALPLFGPLTLAHVDAAEVGVQGAAAAAVLDFHDVAVTTAPTREIDHAFADGAHRCAQRRAIVDAVVLTPGLHQRVHAHGEARGDARELHRAGQKGPAAAATINVVVAAAAIGRREPDRLEAFPAIDEFGSRNPAGTFVPGHRLVVGRQCFVDDAEGVALAQLAVEVDVGGENLRQLTGHTIRQTRLIGGCEQCAADGAAGQSHLRAIGHSGRAGHPTPAGV